MTRHHLPEAIGNDTWQTDPVQPSILQVRAVRRQLGLPWISAMPTNPYGPGDDYLATSIAEIAEFFAAATGFTGSTQWDSSKPDGTPRKSLDVSTLRDSGWQPTISLRDGIEDTVAWFRSHQTALRV